MRSLPTLALVLVTLMLPLLGCAEEGSDPAPTLPATGEWTLPFDGYLPDDPPVHVAVVHVIDEMTREPIEGALVRQCWEIDVGPDGWAPVVRSTRTDAFGLAHIEVPKDELYAGGGMPDAHWMVHAPGYAATEEYGGAIREVVMLRRPRTRHGRIVDAMGRPLANAPIGYKEGCAHAPFLAETTTDANGVFVLSGVEGSGEIYYAGRGVLGSYFFGPMRTLDQTPYTQVAAPCRRIEGRIVGADVADLAPGMIQATAESRGAFARIESDGRFVLDGAESDGLITLWRGPDGSTLELPTDRWRPRHPRVWDIRLGKSNPNISETIAFRQLEVEVLDAKGRPLPDALVVAYRTEDGIEADTDSRDAPDEGVVLPRLVLSLLPGTYDVMLYAEGAYFSEPVRVVIGRDKPKPITLSAQEHPTLEVDFGGLPEDARPNYSVAYLNAEGHIDHDALAFSDGTWVPAGVEARVVAHWGGHSTFHDVGPAVDGVRRVTIRAPKERRIRFTVPFEPEDAHLGMSDVGDVHALGDDRYEITTTLTGTLALIVEASDGERFEPMPYVRHMVTIEPGDGDVIDLGVLSPPPERRARGELTLLDADGTPLSDLRVDITAIEPAAKDEPFLQHIGKSDEAGVVRSHVLRTGAYVAFELDDDDGRREIVRSLEGPGPWTIRMGSGRIELEVHGPWGLLMDSSVLFDGELRSPIYTDAEETREGHRLAIGQAPARYVLDRLDAGPHTLIVTAPGHRGEARRIILKEGETRRIRVDLPERK